MSIFQNMGQHEKSLMKIIQEPSYPTTEKKVPSKALKKKKTDEVYKSDNFAEMQLVGTESRIFNTIDLKGDAEHEEDPYLVQGKKVNVKRPPSESGMNGLRSSMKKTTSVKSLAPIKQHILPNQDIDTSYYKDLDKQMRKELVKQIKGRQSTSQKQQFRTHVLNNRQIQTLQQ